LEQRPTDPEISCNVSVLAGDHDAIELISSFESLTVDQVSHPRATSNIFEDDLTESSVSDCSTNNGSCIADDDINSVRTEDAPLLYLTINDEEKEDDDYEERTGTPEWKSYLQEKSELIRANQAIFKTRPAKRDEPPNHYYWKPV
jgi:hypothetical protein